MNRTVAVGQDEVIIRDEDLIIKARNPMPDWDIRELDPAPIYFEDRKYCLIEKRKSAAPYAVRYLLVPWPDGLTENPKRFYVYDAEAVANRDQNLRHARHSEGWRAVLLPFYPFLGLLWSGTQNRLARLGFIPHSISGASIFTGFCLLFAEGVFSMIMLHASARSGVPMLGGMLRAISTHGTWGFLPVSWVDMFLFLTLLADVPVRYSFYLRDDLWAGGFLEWLSPKAWRKRE